MEVQEKNWERIAVRFQQRLAETVAKYEADIILLREDFEESKAVYDAEIKRLQEIVTQKAE